MIQTLDTFIRQAFPALNKAYISPALGAELQQEKLLLTVASLAGAGMELERSVAARAAQERRKLHRLHALGDAIVDRYAGAASMLKGVRHGSLYPDRVERYQGDLDILMTDESAYVACLAYLTGRGLRHKAGHLTQAIDGGLYASAIFFEPDEAMARGPDSLVVELHLRAFPITPFSHLDMLAPAVAGLAGPARDALVLLAEFVYRDGRTKRFLYRDVLDSLLVFAQISVEQVAALAQAIDACVLWVALGLLRAHLAGLAWVACPASLQLLWADPRCPVPPAGYDFYEHQAWPNLQALGRSRQDYEFLIASYGDINPRDGRPMVLTPFEIGARFARGVPVAFRLRHAGEGAGSLLDACEIVAGPPDARCVVHQRIGA